MRKIKQISCYLSIMILLPYIVTIFMNGADVPVSAGMDLSLEEYCIGRMAKEIPIEYEGEALKAQAILVRTALYKKLEENGDYYIREEDYFTKEQMEQQWGIASYGKNYKKLEQAWRETEGQVLLHEGKLADPPFCKLTNGNTRDGSEILGEAYSYLKIAECPLDAEAREQMQTIVMEEMDVEVLATDKAGYVTEVRVGKEKVSGEEFRNTYGLASSSFTVQLYEGKLRITSRGVGHGFGLSQYTANEMAKSGKTCKEILEYFFDNLQIMEVADVVMNLQNEAE